ncbi:hypothetical protein AB9R04_06480 [Neisseria gonorrhoeae]
MTDLISTTVLLTPYQAFQAKKWHLQNIEEHNLIQKKRPEYPSRMFPPVSAMGSPYG